MSYRNKEADRVLLAFVRQFHAEHGYAPTVREVQEALGVAATSTAHFRMERLIREGLLSNKPGDARTLCITPAGMVLIDGTVEL